MESAQNHHSLGDSFKKLRERTEKKSQNAIMFMVYYNVLEGGGGIRFGTFKNLKPNLFTHFP